jgi:hypothetical protein
MDRHLKILSVAEYYTKIDRGGDFYCNSSNLATSQNLAGIEG